MKPKKTPRTRKPDHLSLEEWQIALRREFGQEQPFRAKNLGKDPVYSDFAVTNPASGRTYRVAIRSDELGANYCSCPDFAVNALGTCKHVEWLLAKLKRKQGARKAFARTFQPDYSEIYLEYGARRRVRFRPGVSLPAEWTRLVKRYFDEAGILRDDAYEGFPEFVRKARESEADIRFYDDALEFVAQRRDDAVRRRAVEKTFEGRGSSAALNKLVKTRLYPYQKEGVLFAAKAGRCLIADDMGLGKTVQAIAAAEVLARVSGTQQVLVVCPAALKWQWKQEVEKFTDRTALVVEGLRPARAQLYAEDSFYKIVNYETVHRDLDLINGWRPDLVILDEAQRIKNWETRRAKSVKAIDSPYAIVLTGTPLENRLSELHSIVEFVDRYHLGPLYRFLADHQHVDEQGKVIGYRNLDRIGENLAPVLLRRHKRDVLQQLPPRSDKHLFVDMTASQQAIHEENREIVAKIVAKWRRRGFLSDQDQRRLMVAMQYMRMACNSTYLVDKVTDEGPKIDECSLLLDDLLSDPENKVVVFSQWLGTHELLTRRFDAAGWPYAYYHGSLDSKGRKKAIEDFKRNGKCRILLCTDSGGVGLNLQQASIVVNMDQPWNPAVLEQRIGRVHRLGQHRHVQVYHFVSRGTIEDGMLGVLKFKSSLSAGVLDGGEREIFLGGTKMKQFMERVEKVTDSIPDVAPQSEASVDPANDETVPAESERGEAASVASQQDRWNDLIATGLDLLAKLSQVVQSSSGEKSGTAVSAAIARNEKTGAPELRIPIPDGETAEKLGKLLTGLGDLLTVNGRSSRKSGE
ncbi:MAG: hypothetical protein AMXMBFR82_46210 [Candidatus Hydrogenedentota bacterium]